MSDRGLLATEFVEAHFDQLNLFQGAGLVDVMNCPDGLVVQLLKWPRAHAVLRQVNNRRKRVTKYVMGNS